MSMHDCGEIRDRLPALARGTLDATGAAEVRSGVEACEECRAELALLEALSETRPEPSPALAARLKVSLREEGVSRPNSRRWWTAVAATVVLALGTGIVWDEVRSSPGMLEPISTEEFASNFSSGEDDWVAGAPVLDDLSDDELAMLLEGWDDEA